MTDKEMFMCHRSRASGLNGNAVRLGRIFGPGASRRLQEMVELLRLARQRLDDWQIWVNPDCGLKTRNWQEVKPALESLVAAAHELRRSANTPSPA
jgi:hypothetical protein